MGCRFGTEEKGALRRYQVMSILCEEGENIEKFEDVLGLRVSYRILSWGWEGGKQDCSRMILARESTLTCVSMHAY